MNEQNNKQTMHKSMICYGSESRLALYSSLFHTFAIFRKRQKINVEKACSKSSFLVQKRDLGAQGSIDLTILGDF